MSDVIHVPTVVCPDCGAECSASASTCESCAGPISVASDRAPTQIVAAPPPADPSPAPNEPDDPEPTSERFDFSSVRADYDPDSVPSTGPDPLIGLVVAGRYRIRECIGRGGMGVVYRVEHTEIGKLLALKLLAGELSRQREVVRRFKREALLASKLSHPNTVQVFDFGVSDGLTYLVMELVTGRDLHRIIRAEGSISVSRLAKIMIQVCSSLAEAHGIGMVHRDVKPENILVAQSRDGPDFAKVLDFGLAKLRETTELNEVTGTGQVVGTPYYMAPEQIHGLAVDGRADIYALGAVMYEALTGTTVFQGTSPMAVFTKHLTEEPTPPRVRAPNQLISPAMEAIIMRALQKDPGDRYQRIEDLQAALVEQLDRLGESSIDVLLNSDQLIALQADIRNEAAHGLKDQGLSRTIAHAEIATRDEVTAFKRKMVRQRWFSVAVAVAVAGALGYAGIRTYRQATKAPTFHGAEREPNNQASEANPVPFGVSVRGKLGKRIDPERSDRDFYRVEVPSSCGLLSFNTTAIPNLATCTWLYREGEVDPRARFCAGRPGVDLNVSSFRVDPGAHFFVVLQDRNQYGEAPRPLVLENVSDEYTFTVTAMDPDSSVELEPNDVPEASSRVPIGGGIRGTLPWVKDIDYVCVRRSGPPGQVRWIVRDAEEGPRDPGAVLEVTPTSGPEAGTATRVHRTKEFGTDPTPHDEVNPWRSEPFSPEDGGGPHCLRLRLVSDPWSGPDAPLTPPASDEHWFVRVESSP